MLAETGAEWTNDYVDRKKFTELKPSLDFGALPALRINGKGDYLVEQSAIVLLLGRRHGKSASSVSFVPTFSCSA